MSDWFNDPFFTESTMPSPEHMFNDVHQRFSAMENEMSNLMKAAFSTFSFDDHRRGGRKALDSPHNSQLPYEDTSKSNGSRNLSQRTDRFQSMSPYDGTTTMNTTHSRNDTSKNGLTYDSRSQKTNSLDGTGSMTQKSPYEESSKRNMSPYDGTVSMKQSNDFSKTKDAKPYYYCSYSSNYYNNEDGFSHSMRKDFDSTGKQHLGEYRGLGDKSVAYERRINGNGAKPEESVRHTGISPNEEESFNKSWNDKRQNQRSLGYRSGNNVNHNQLGYTKN